VIDANKSSLARSRAQANDANQSAIDTSKGLGAPVKATPIPAPPQPTATPVPAPTALATESPTPPGPMVEMHVLISVEASSRGSSLASTPDDA
jgi:hypothetical protein